MLASNTSSMRLALTAVVSALLSEVTAVDTVNDCSCDCFLTNGSQPMYLTQRALYDFRSLSQYAGAPNVINSSDGTASAPASSDYFTSTAWSDAWELQTWSNSKGDGQGLSGDAAVLMVNSLNNAYIDKNAVSSSTCLTMRTQRLPDFQTAAEFQAKQSNYHFLSLRVNARTVGDAGAVAAFFTYRSADKLVDIQEADVEILTRGPRTKVQYTNQPSYTETDDQQGDDPRATRNASMPFGKTVGDWAVYRLDWTPSRSVWYVDGQQVADIAFQVPRDPAGLNINMWSDGGNWSGNMSVGGEAKLQVQWIEILFNTTANEAKSKRRLPRRAASGAGNHPMCRRVCSIDEIPHPGTVVKLWDGPESAAVVKGASWRLLLLLLAGVLTLRIL